ncbi:uncharacterized protein LOC108488269 [Gossypium arboreum]|uniref:uncharacterized protein LOC108488269 n=1 Tax=Gossypium arboreum TaxID=29729 RepID=UPI0008196D8A|nr:uncharacterized protein LOC108488269 [Gossypium arboreum]
MSQANSQDTEKELALKLQEGKIDTEDKIGGCQEACRPGTMKTICWNICGLGSPRATRRLWYLLKQHKPQMVFFMETKIDGKRMEKFQRRYGFENGIDVGAEGSRGGICMAWKTGITVVLKNFSRNHIDVMVKDENFNEKWRFTGFYGSPYVQDKNASWNLLRQLGKDQNHPCLVCGYFNEIMYFFEKSRGQSREEKRMEAFREVLNECQLMDVGYMGVWFTCEGGNLPETNIKERLNRGVANEKWMQLFPNGTIHHLTHTISDHYPLLISTNSGKSSNRSQSFKFEAWWIMEESFEQEVRIAWESSDGSICEKLDRLKFSLVR